jgi:L-asparaginase
MVGARRSAAVNPWLPTPAVGAMVAALLLMLGAPPLQASPEVDSETLPAGAPPPAVMPTAGADTTDLPRVHVLATGGTISNTDGDRLTGDDLVQSVPQIGDLARFTVEQFTNVASGAITLENWLHMRARIEELYSEDEPPVGIVVTHGTDTMEETAYFLDLTLADCRPVVITGAMRTATMAGADGPANLLNAVRLVVHERAEALGTVVLMNDEIFPAREVIKIHTSRMNAFAAPGVGPLGVADPDAVVIERRARPRSCGTPAFDLTGVDTLPRVEVIHTHLGADGALIRGAVEAGAQGIVMAAVGRGGTTPDQRAALDEARSAGVVVVRSSRTGAGRVPVGQGNDDDELAPILGAGDLSPQKARILLMLALTRTRDGDELREIFQTH